MISKFLIDMVTVVAMLFFKLILPNMPIAQVCNGIITIIGNFAYILSQAGNFGHFLLGDSIFVLMPIIVYIMSFKYIIYPVFSVIRNLLLRFIP